MREVADCAADTCHLTASVPAGVTPHMLAQRLDAIMSKRNMLAYTLCIELSFFIYRQLDSEQGCMQMMWQAVQDTYVTLATQTQAG